MLCKMYLILNLRGKCKMKKSKRTGVDFWELLTFVFIILKLTNVIAWSWLWVLSPIWIPYAIVLVLLVMHVLS